MLKVNLEESGENMHVLLLLQCLWHKEYKYIDWQKFACVVKLLLDLERSNVWAEEPGSVDILLRDVVYVTYFRDCS